jgi:hypothetical protein
MAVASDRHGVRRAFQSVSVLPGMRAQASELSPSLCAPTRRSRATGSCSGRVLLGHRPVVSRWLVPDAEFLKPDDLDQAEPVGVRA